jgi:hypothetical protein
MGHCLGLGHEFYHPNWPHNKNLLGICNCKTFVEIDHCRHHVDTLKRIHKQGYLAQIERYTVFGGYDPNSIMNYNPSGLGISGVSYSQPQKLSPGDISLINYLYPDALPF